MKAVVKEDEPEDAGPRISGRGRARRLRLSGSWSGLLIPLVVLFAVFATTAPYFLAETNLIELMEEAGLLGIIVAGMTFVIIGAEIDVSVGSATALYSTLVAVFVTNDHVPILLACVIVALLGATIGAIAGWIRAVWSVSSIIVTLVLLLILEGVAQVVTNDSPVLITAPTFFKLAGGSVWRVPVPALVMVVVFAVAGFVLRRTSFGRGVFAIGGNAEAAYLAGVPVKRIRIALFACSGFLAAITGILWSARLQSGNADITQNLEFQAIAAVIIGGTSLFGGKGSLIGSLFGVVLLTMITDALVLYGVNTYAQGVVEGAVLLIAVLASSVQEGRVRFGLKPPWVRPA
jgi:ribose/xylose/arabinose/galactoside ABC-type transport system permease subunit